MKITIKDERSAKLYAGEVYIDEKGRAWIQTTGQWTPEPNVQNIPREPECECGAFKSIGAARGSVGHSNWCPWVK